MIDTAAAHGLQAIAQVDLGSRGHKHQTSHDLAVMAAELMLVADRRRNAISAANGSASPAGQVSRDRGEDLDPVLLQQFVRSGGEMRQRSRPVPVAERPPARSVKG